MKISELIEKYKSAVAPPVEKQIGPKPEPPKKEVKKS